MKSFYSHGKLLLTGEYVVLDGALSLALPSKYGQSLEITSTNTTGLIWKSFDHNHSVWYEGHFQINNKKIKSKEQDPVSERLIEILSTVEGLKPGFFDTISGRMVKTEMEFPNNWGLGSSSTLINNIANWAGIDPYLLLENTFGGSGYDLACANAKGPLTYQLKKTENSISRSITPVSFDPIFKDHLYFVHLNRKQDSRQGIAQYKKHRNNVESVVNEISEITSSFVHCKHLEDFQKLIREHETIISNITNQVPVKDLLFHDIKGEMKSLGAWGGDFILVATDEDPTTYFNTNGYHTILKFSDMIL